ncbi:hypothetical protein [Geodermatophilus sp. SYSU D00696]
MASVHVTPQAAVPPWALASTYLNGPEADEGDDEDADDGEDDRPRVCQEGNDEAGHGPAGDVTSPSGVPHPSRDLVRYRLVFPLCHGFDAMAGR